MRKIIIVAAGILLCSAFAARAEFYRYMDQDGKEVFTNDLK